MIWDSRKEENERRRFVEEGLRKRSPGLAVAVFFLAMWLGGWACSAVLLALGVSSIPTRYAISTLVSYGIFIGSVGVWCRHVAKSRASGDGPGSSLGLDLPADVGGGEGCLLVLAVIAIAGLASAAFWWVGGYALLFEVAFEVAFAGTMVYRMGKRDTLGDWAGTLVRRTWLPALVMGGLLVALGAKLQQDHPNARTTAQAIEAYRSTNR